MLSNRIIGKVGAEVLLRRIQDARFPDGTRADSAALFRLDKLSSAQVAAIVREILANPELAGAIDLQIPAGLVLGEDLPASVLTQENAGAVRNGGTSREALLTANGNEHNLADTLGHVTAIGAKEFRDNAKAWAEATCQIGNVALAAEDRKVFRTALRGLVTVEAFSLNQLADFCADLIEAMSTKGLAIRDAIGWAMPAVGLPRDTAYFSNTRTYGTVIGAWSKAFDKLFKMRKPLLERLRPNGQALDPEELEQRLDEHKETIDPTVVALLRSFIHAPRDDGAIVRKVVELEWETAGVHWLFERARERQQGLSDSTRHFFDHECSEPDVLDAPAKQYLDDLKARERSSQWTEADDEGFYERYRYLLEQDKALLSRWEKGIFGKPVDCDDFLEGLVNVAQRLVATAGEGTQPRFLRFRIAKGRTVWRERFNYDVGSYFSTMYRGLQPLLANCVEWSTDRMGAGSQLPSPLFFYPQYFAGEQALRPNGTVKPCTSVSRAAVQIKFDVSIQERQGASEVTLGKTQLIWNFRPESIGLALLDDMRRLKEKGGVAVTDVPRRLVSKKGGVQSVSLLDTGTLEATFSRDAGSLVPTANRLTSLRHQIKRTIADLAAQNTLSTEQQAELREAWDRFETDYGVALDDFTDVGLHTDAILRQADSYASLLRSLTQHARSDICRATLVTDVLSVGTVRVTGDHPAVIIPPWHPERMKALAIKTRRVAAMVSHMLSKESVRFGDRGIFFREFSEELAHPFYPEIAVFRRNTSAELVTETSTVNGYSLLEPPVRGSDDSLTDVDPRLAAKQVRELVERYVALQPHESNNLSLLLYNADAAELPLAVVRELADLQESTSMQCSVAIRHRDPAKLRRVYAELVSKAGADSELPLVSETSENFISSLRISVAPTSHTTADTGGGFRSYDIAFLHDVVSRTATPKWLTVPWSNDRPDIEHAPSRWSYRRVSGEDELKSTTFLTCPRQTATGWAYVTAVASVVGQTDVDAQCHLLPARQISLLSDELAATMQDAHALAEWVATYDALLDRRQLQANKITVVRYRRAATNGRNMIVSSTSELRLLGVLTRRRLSELGLGLPDGALDALAQRVKTDALTISGDIVLRAAKRGVSAGEMLGLVLSRHLIDEEFRTQCAGRPYVTAYFLLDDYADWLAQKENRIADILALCVEERESGPCLHIAVIESKYVSEAGVAEAKRASKVQLLATLSTFRAALFGDPGHLDRDVWLARLADLLIDATIPPGATALLERARAAVSEGIAPISLRGYSHIYSHSADPDPNMRLAEQNALESVDGIHAWQEVFDRKELRALVLSYAERSPSLDVRKLLGPDAPWMDHELRAVAPRVIWSNAGQAAAALDVSNIAIVQPATTSPEDLNLVETTTPVPESRIPRLALIPEPSTPLSQLIAQHAIAVTENHYDNNVWIEETARKLKLALNSYRLQANVLGTRKTPNGCLVRLAGSDRLRVEDIESKRTQLLTTHALTVVTVQPKPGEIIVTLAGPQRESVSLWKLWAQRTLNRNAAGINTSFVIGVQELNGAILYLNLGQEFGGLSSHEPHTLVAGATGSGKSVLIQSLLLDIAATNSHHSAQIILIDPKMGVDYAALEALPHFREPIITTRERATQVLTALLEEMEKRYRLFAAARARDLATYNTKVAIAEHLPMVFLVHDEFADWMLDDDYKAAVSTSVQRLGVKARAAGIHLIFAAQRPDKDVMPMQLRENLGNRLILKVASEATSRIVLDRGGAELLLGKGHVAAKLAGEAGLLYGQAPYLSDEDLRNTVDAIRQPC